MPWCLARRAPGVERGSDRLGAIQSLPLGARHDRGELVRCQADGNDLRGRGSTRGATPAGAELVDVVSGFYRPLIDPRLIDFVALDDALHEFIVIRNALRVERNQRLSLHEGADRISQFGHGTATVEFRRCSRPQQRLDLRDVTANLVLLLG